MANPNIVNVATINGKTQTFALDTTLTTSLVANAGSSGKIFKINTIIVTNIDGTNAADVTISYNDGSNTRAIASTIAVPADSSIVVIDKNSSFYVLEKSILELLLIFIVSKYNFSNSFNLISSLLNE